MVPASAMVMSITVIESWLILWSMGLFALCVLPFLDLVVKGRLMPFVYRAFYRARLPLSFRPLREATDAKEVMVIGRRAYLRFTIAGVSLLAVLFLVYAALCY